jgi:hypothetical protein
MVAARCCISVSPSIRLSLDRSAVRGGFRLSRAGAKGNSTELTTTMLLCGSRRRGCKKYSLSLRAPWQNPYAERRIGSSLTSGPEPSRDPECQTPKANIDQVFRLLSWIAAPSRARQTVLSSADIEHGGRIIKIPPLGALITVMSELQRADLATDVFS